MCDYFPVAIRAIPLTIIQSGLVPAEDAPDIIANTFLAGITEDQIDKVGCGFLQHSHRMLLISSLTAQLFQLIDSYSAVSN